MKNDRSVFSANVVFKDGEDDTVDVELDKSEVDLTYDDVEAALFDAVDKKHGYTFEDWEEDEAPYYFTDIMVLADDGIYPVVPEDYDTKLIDNDKQYDKYLMLPYARYSLTPECKLWMKMRENGILEEDDEFDYDEMHKLVEVIETRN